MKFFCSPNNLITIKYEGILYLKITLKIFLKIFRDTLYGNTN